MASKSSKNMQHHKAVKNKTKINAIDIATVRPWEIDDVVRGYTESEFEKRGLTVEKVGRFNKDRLAVKDASEKYVMSAYAKANPAGYAEYRRLNTLRADKIAFQSSFRDDMYSSDMQARMAYLAVGSTTHFPNTDLRSAPYFSIDTANSYSGTIQYVSQKAAERGYKIVATGKKINNRYDVYEYKKA